MINDAKSVFLVAPHALLAPGAAVTLAVLAFNLAGEYIGSTMAVSPSLLTPSAGRPGWMTRRSAAGGDGEPERD